MILKDCKKCGGVGVPFYKGHTCCKTCKNASNAAWNKSNPEKIRAYGVASYAANPGKKKSPSAAYYAANPEKYRAYQAEWRAANPERAKANKAAWRKANPEKTKAMSLKRKYGLTLEQHTQMLVNQNEKCAICRDTLTSGNGTHVDHCHTTGKVRALLCHRCNLMLGHSKDSPSQLRSAANYLEHFSTAL